MDTDRNLRRLPVIAGLLLVLVAASCQPAAPAAQEAKPAAAPASANLFLMVDMVLGSKNIPADQAPARSCVMNSRFPRNSQVVWRARVFDPATGALMDDKALSKVEVKLGNGETIKMRYGPHPATNPNAEKFWTGSWVVPKDNATGTLDYSVGATGADGRSGEFKQFSSQPSLLTITDEVLEDAAPKA